MSDCDARGERDPVEPPGLALRSIDHERRYVLGYPVHVAITVCADPPGAYLRRLPWPSWAGNAGAIGVRLVRSDTREAVVQTEPSPVVLPELGTPMFVLAPGACRRMLIDVSSYLPAGLEPGSYELAIVYDAPPDRVESAPVPIELAAPGPEEQRELQRLAPELARAGSWGRWTSLLPEDRTPVEVRVEPGDPLRFNRIVRHLIHGPDALCDIDPDVLDVLDGVYAPEAHGLRAELYAARGDAARFAEQAAIIRAWYPGLAWWIERIEAGQSEYGFIGACRERRRGQ
ncbi:hypothetical protein SOCEGT47_025510 [Sorangium cellulosum]|uniref:Uncharacterized protein n=1 Tax=Sorangium cellulosum TaxID=56 RepID=A0A4P2PZ11_SORCE|nr:hypothetical protein [Sorangium cellulosum]AUX22050.1 hypothetical protein SOCEGT47_025510 [Sorangium cellulosum]